MTTNRLVMWSWQQAASALGLAYDADPQHGMQITGWLGGRSVAIRERFLHHPQLMVHTSTLTEFTVRLVRHDVAAGLIMRSGGRLRRPRFIVTGDRNETRRLLTAHRRRALRQACPPGYTWTLIANDVVHRRRQLMIDESQLVERMGHLMSVARALDDDPPSHILGGEAGPSSPMVRLGRPSNLPR